MSNYTQLTREQRYQIYALMKAGLYQTQIAKIVGVHKSTISREMRRNRGLRGYRPKQAHHFSKVRRAKAVRTQISPHTWALVKRLLRDDWSPEQISGWLGRACQIPVSHESNRFTSLSFKINDRVELCSCICAAKNNVENVTVPPATKVN